MKYVLKLTMTLALFLGITVTGFAFVDRNTKPEQNDPIKKQNTKVKPDKSGRHRLKKIGNKKRNSVIRVPRLTARQRRDFFRRLIDIRIN